MKIFISPLAKPDWAVDKDVFIEALKTNWKEVLINKIEDESRKYSFTWSITQNGTDVLEGKLDKDGSTFVLESEDYPLLYKCSLYCRAFMPSTAHIIFYDENYSFNLELNDELSEKDFIDTFLA